MTALNIGSVTGSTEQPDTSESIMTEGHWVPAAENPFGVDILDCSAFAQSTVATTSSAEVAARFSQLREDTGEHCRGKEPALAFTTEYHLEYPSAVHQDGPIFTANQMEDKWDIYLFDGDFYFARSWTGDLVFKARVTFDHLSAKVTKISGQRESSTFRDPVAVVDFLVKSHVYGLVAPHPLPNTPETQPSHLASWSFARYGRRGLFGTKSDVTHLMIVRGEDGRCSLKLPN